MAFFRLPEMQENSRIAVLPSSMIPLYGFGEGKISRYHNGIYRTERVRRAYRMACSHVIDSELNLGRPCFYCQIELQTSIQEALLLGQLIQMTPEQIEYVCSSCLSCTFQCGVMLCSRTICRRHVAILPPSETQPAGGTLCLEHYMMLDLESRILLEGPFIYKVKQFIKGLFHLGGQ